MLNNAYTKGERERKVIAIYKRVEDIRKDKTNLSQTDFAKEIGMSYRSYQERITGERPKWLVSEIVKASLFNKGKILVDIDGREYAVSIKPVE